MFKGIKTALVELAQAKLDQQIDGREITRNLDATLDENLGEKASESIQRGLLTNLLLEMLEGLWEEDINALRQRLVEHASQLGGGL